MGRSPLPELTAQPSSGAARLASAPARVVLAADESAVTMTLAPGPHELVLLSMHATVWRGERDLHAGLNEVVFDVSKLPGVTGRCVDEEGRPLEGVMVSQPDFNTVSVLTGADGHFLVPLLSAEAIYRFVATKAGFCDVTAEPRVLAPDHLTTMDTFVLQPARVVSGRVELKDGTAVVGCTVQARCTSGGVASKAPVQLTSDSEGRFRFDKMPAGDVRLWTSHPMLLNASVLLPDAIEERSTTLVLDEGAFIDGTVRYDDDSELGSLSIYGMPVAQPGGSPIHAESSQHMAQVSGLSNHFSLGPFPPGPVAISEMSLQYDPQVFQAPSTIELVLPARRDVQCAFRFTDASTGLPITKSGSLTVLRAIGGATVGEASGFAVQPDGNGLWTFRQSIEPGVSVSLVVRFADYLAARMDGLERSATEGEVTEVRVEPFAGLRVRVQQASGTPVAGAKVSLI